MNVCAAGSANIGAIGQKNWNIRVLDGFTNVNGLRMPYVVKAGIDPSVAKELQAALIAQKTFSEVLDKEYDSLREELKEASQFDDR